MGSATAGLADSEGWPVHGDKEIKNGEAYVSSNPSYVRLSMQEFTAGGEEFLPMGTTWKEWIDSGRAPDEFTYVDDGTNAFVRYGASAVALASGDWVKPTDAVPEGYKACKPVDLVFTINSRSYSVEAGTTWGQWITSGAAPSGYLVEGTCVMYERFYVVGVYGDSYVGPSDVIILGAAYVCMS